MDRNHTSLERIFWTEGGERGRLEQEEGGLYTDKTEEKVSKKAKGEGHNASKEVAGHQIK